MPDTRPPGPVTENAIARLPSGRLVHVDEIDGHIALVSEIDEDGRITDTEATWLASRLTLVEPAPGKPEPEPEGRAIVGQMAAAEDRAGSIEEFIASTNVALDAMLARLAALMEQAARLVGQTSITIDPGRADATVIARVKAAMESGASEAGRLVPGRVVPSRRDLAAHAALIALATADAGSGFPKMEIDHAARKAYRIADAMESAATAPRTGEDAR